MNDDDTPWEYKSDDGKIQEDHTSRGSHRAEPAEKSSPKSVSWEGLEYIDHQRGFNWYVALVIVTLALAAGCYFLTKDKIAVGIIVVVGIIVAVFVNQKPGKAQYEINETGVSVNGKVYPYNNYKSFALISEGRLSSVNLFPLKRFMPPLSVYFDPKDESKVMKAMGNYLPYEQRGLDAVDRLTRRLRI